MPRFLRTKARLAAAFGAAAFAAAIALVIAIVAGGDHSRSPTTRSAATVAGARDVAAGLAGIPQRGAVLGSAEAPLTMVEFADVQCPYCAEFGVRVLPDLVRDYVRTGKLRVIYDGMAFIGPDSVTGLKTAIAAGRQNRLWNVLELLSRNQGRENSGWVSDGLLRAIGTAAGLDVAKLMRDRATPSVAATLEAMSQTAVDEGITSTPSFLVGRTGQPLQRLTPSSLDLAGFEPTLDALLAE